MDDLDFRKKLTEYGISKEEYEAMTEEEKSKIDKKIKTELKSDNIKKVGKGIQGVGCLMILIPIAIVMIAAIFIAIF
ncbi:hypothetical protein [Senegalia massiliensis]|uniref:hypothetical protein n=1 Tax=Senegalia massiliensis TaxID=1720316 RepID=UPI0010317E21|nr:hypothetical protein [Senegalia massiliensis]